GSGGRSCPLSCACPDAGQVSRNRVSWRLGRSMARDCQRPAQTSGAAAPCRKLRETRRDEAWLRRPTGRPPDAHNSSVSSAKKVPVKIIVDVHERQSGIAETLAE